MATVIRFTRPAVLFLSLAGLAGTARAQLCPLFDPVYATMTQDRGGDSPGCRGCHIAAQHELGTWFGDTEEDVLSFFLNDTHGRALVSRGRQSLLARALGLVDGVDPYMPRDAPFDGRFWVDDPDQGLTELTDLGNWLDTIDF